MPHDPVMSDLNAHLNEMDRREAIWAAYEDWAQGRTDAEKVKAYEDFIHGGKQRVSGEVTWIGENGTASFGLAGIRCDLSEAFDEWDYENNWPDHPDKRRG